MFIYFFGVTVLSIFNQDRQLAAVFKQTQERAVLTSITSAQRAVRETSNLPPKW